MSTTSARRAVTAAVASLSLLLSMVLTGLIALPAQADDIVTVPESQTKFVLDHGHIDAFHIIPDGSDGIAINLKEDVTALGTERVPEDVILHVKESAAMEVPAGFPGGGARGYVLPLTQNPDLIWPGWETTPARPISSDITIRVESVDGPGDVYVWTSGNFGQIASLVDTADHSLPGNILVPGNAHVHANWNFTEAGLYTLRVSAVTPDGATTRTATYTFVVGDFNAADTSTTLTADGEAVEAGESTVLTAEVSPASVKGWIGFFENGEALTYESVSEGRASISVRQPEAGDFTYTAKFIPEVTNFATESESETVAVTVTDPVVEPDPEPTEGPTEPEVTLPGSSERRILNNVHTDAVSLFYEDGSLVLESQADVDGQLAKRFDPERLIFNVNDASKRTRPANALFDFLGVPAGTELWIAPETNQMHTGQIFAGFSTETIRPNPFDNGNVFFTLDEVSGPGRVEIYQNTEDGPGRLFSSEDELAPWVTFTPAHVHMNWAFTESGFYDLTFTARASVDGEEMTATNTYTFYVGALEAVETVTVLTVDSTEVEVGDSSILSGSVTPADVDGWVAFFRDGVAVGYEELPESGEVSLPYVHTASGSVDFTAQFIPADTALAAASESSPVEVVVTGGHTGPTPTPTPEPTPTPDPTPAEPICTGDGQTVNKLVLTEGHIDTFNVTPRGNGIALNLKEDITGSHVHQVPEEVILYVKEEALTDIPSGFPGGGTRSYLLPLTQNHNLIWPGWDTLEAQNVAQDVTINIQSVDGPGDVYIFSSGVFGEPTALVDTADHSAPGKILVPGNAHVHANWVFTEAGTYTFTVQAEAGSLVSNTATYTFVVGGPVPSGIETSDCEIPAPVDADALTNAQRGGLTADKDIVRPGDAVTVEGFEVPEVFGWLHSDPAELGWLATGDGTARFRIPVGTPAGEHRVVFLNLDGDVIGWVPLTVIASADDDNGNGSSDDDSTHPDDSDTPVPDSECIPTQVTTTIPASRVTAITSGHQDLGTQIVGGRLVPSLKDDRQSPAVWIDPSSVVFELGDAAKTEATSEMSFIASPGSTVYAIPSTQIAGVPWLGGNTMHPSVLNNVNGGVTWTLASVQGPGNFAMYLAGPLGGGVGQRQLDNVGGPRSWTVRPNTHEHGNWVFSEPGVYRLTINQSATLNSGQRVSGSTVLTFAVGVPAQSAARDTTTVDWVGKTADGEDCELSAEQLQQLSATGAGQPALIAFMAVLAMLGGAGVLAQSKRTRRPGVRSS